MIAHARAAPAAWGGARLVLLGGAGCASLLGYLAARGLGNLRLDTVGFELAFLPTFALYLIAVAVVLRLPRASGTSWQTLALIFLFGLFSRLTLLPTWPTLPAAMFRY